MADSTTHWVLELQAGNRQAAEELWERYYIKLVSFARSKLRSRRSGGTADENDVALSAFASFYRAAENGRFPQLSNGNDLWRLLIVIAQRKILHQLRADNCQKRLAPAANAAEPPPMDLGDIASSEPTPEFYAVAIESFRNLMERLEDPALRSIAQMKMEGYTNEEISLHLSCSLSTIERKLRRIRHEWSDASERLAGPDR